jgi:hypothetical protein
MLLAFLLCIKTSAVFAQPNAQLQLSMIGNGAGPYYAPAGQTTQLKIEILNLGPSDVFLVRGKAFLDPNLSNNWQLIRSEDTGNFHLAKLQSAIWTFDLQMPSNIQAQNITNGVPQVELLVQIVYSTTQGQQQSADGQFLLSVPGAGARQADYSIWFVFVGLAVVALAVVVFRKMSKSSSERKAVAVRSSRFAERQREKYTLYQKCNFMY